MQSYQEKMHIIAKIHAFGFDIWSLKLIHSYLNKINDIYSSLQKNFLLFLKVQSMVLFLIYIFCDLFIVITYYDITNYMDASPYSTGKNVNVLLDLRKSFDILLIVLLKTV